jgi:hypothetical protein
MADVGRVSSGAPVTQVDPSIVQDERAAVQQGQNSVTDVAKQDANPQIKDAPQKPGGEETPSPATGAGDSRAHIAERSLEGTIMQASLQNNLISTRAGGTNAGAPGTGLQTKSTGPAAPTLVRSNNQTPKPEVRTLQESINKWREARGEGKITDKDGVFGPDTEKALKEFQDATGIKPVDGAFGPATRERMSIMLDILKHKPDALGAGQTLPRLLASDGFRNLGPAQNEVLKRTLNYVKTPGTLDNIRLMTNVITEPGFDQLSHSSKAKMLDVLAARPGDSDLADNLSQLAAASQFRNLSEPMREMVLGRIKSYGGNRTRIDNLENMITATMGFDRLSRDSQRAMFTALANHPNDSRLVDSLRMAAENPNFAPLNQDYQNEVIRLVTQYPRNPANVDNLMNLVSRQDFRDLPAGVQFEVLDKLPSRFNNVQLTPAMIGNMITMMNVYGFEKLRPETRELMLDVLAARPDNTQLAGDLQNVAQNGRFWNNPRAAAQEIMRINDAIP